MNSLALRLVAAASLLAACGSPLHEDGEERLGTAAQASQRAPRPRPVEGYQALLNDVGYGPSLSLTAQLEGAPLRTASGVIEAGLPLVVRHQNRRLVSLAEATTVVLHARLDEVHLPSHLAAHRAPSGAWVTDAVSLPLPEGARGTLELWFELRNAHDRAVGWDSAQGRNYALQVLPAGGATFILDEGRDPVVSGEPQAGQTLRLRYDAERLRAAIAREVASLSSFAVDAALTFDGGPITRLPLTSVNAQGELQVREAAALIPEGASEAQLWFIGSAWDPSRQAMREVFDSRGGANYRIAIQR